MTGSQRTSRNPEQVRALSSDFLTRREYYNSPSRLVEAALMPQTSGEGINAWSWLATGRQMMGDAASFNWHLTILGLASEDFHATSKGAPYITCNGTNEGLWATGATSIWAIFIRDSIVWSWVRPAQLSSSSIYTICSKQDAAAGTRQWHKGWFGSGAGGVDAFRLSISADCTNWLTVDSSYSASINNWYFVAGLYQQSSRFRIYVAAATDDDLTMNQNDAAAPASVCSLSNVSSFGIGVRQPSAGGIDWWNGDLSMMVHYRGNKLATAEDYLTYIFHLTKNVYLDT